MEQEILPEHESIDTFAEFLAAEDRDYFSFIEAETIAKGLKIATYVVINGLKDYGFTYEGRASEKRVRGFKSNSHDRWQAYPSCGGSGWEQISGFAGKSG
jgi:hypothetical protein